MYGDDLRVSFDEDVWRLGTYVISKTDLKAAEGNLVGVRPPLMGHKIISMTARYAHLSSAHQDAAVDRLEG
jgi:hypothetical protein